MCLKPDQIFIRPFLTPIKSVDGIGDLALSIIDVGKSHPGYVILFSKTTINLIDTWTAKSKAIGYSNKTTSIFQTLNYTKTRILLFKRNCFLQQIMIWN